MKSQHAMLKEEFRNAAENYWVVITTSGWSAESLEERRRRLAAIALRLHIFEQGRRQRDRERRK